jgi:hypothetical protein
LPLTDRNSRMIVAQFYARIAPVPTDHGFRRPVDDIDEDED